MNPYIDSDTIDLCHQALRDGRTLDDLAVRLHVDTELLGRLLQLPSVKPAVTDEADLWRVPELEYGANCGSRRDDASASHQADSGRQMK